MRSPNEVPEVRVARVLLGITQEELARRASTSQTIISRIERGVIGRREGEVLPVIWKKLRHLAARRQRSRSKPPGEEVGP